MKEMSRQRRWQLANPEKHQAIVAETKRRRREKGVPYNKHTKTSSEWRLYRYGITDAGYQKMFLDQDGKCAICREPMTKVCVDHCHDTGKVRGLLCDRCNVGLGRFRDDANLIAAALTYLTR